MQDTNSVSVRRQFPTQLWFEKSDNTRVYTVKCTAFFVAFFFLISERKKIIYSYLT